MVQFNPVQQPVMAYGIVPKAAVRLSRKQTLVASIPRHLKEFE